MHVQNNLSKVESALPEGSPNKEAGEVDTAVYGTHFEGLRRKASPFRKTVEQRQWYEQMTTTRPCKSNELSTLLTLTTTPVTRDETRLLHTSVILENKRLYALRAQARGENPFTTVQQFPDSYFDVNDPEINWNSVMDSIPPRSADQCRIMYVSTELPAISHSNWSSEEYEKLKQIVEIHNEASSEPVADVERDREKLRVDWVEISQELGVSLFDFLTLRRTDPLVPCQTNRTTLQCLRKFVFEPSPLEVASKDKENPGGGTSKGRDRAAGNPWSDDEDKFLLEGIQRHGMGNWPEVALHLNAAMAGRPNHMARTPNQCSFRYSKSLCPTIKKGKWTKEEDQALRKGVASFGRMWTKVQEYVQGRTDAQCRERWSNMLDPSLKTGPWEEEVSKERYDGLTGLDLKCAKRYQMLIKLRDGGLSPAEAQAQASNRGKKRKEAQASPQSPSGEEAPVASGDLDRGPSDISSANGVAASASASAPRARPKPRPRPKPKGQAKVVVSEGGMLQNKKGKAPVNSLEGVQENNQVHDEQNTEATINGIGGDGLGELGDKTAAPEGDTRVHTSVGQPRRSALVLAWSIRPIRLGDGRIASVQHLPSTHDYPTFLSSRPRSIDRQNAQGRHHHQNHQGCQGAKGAKGSAFLPIRLRYDHVFVSPNTDADVVSFQHPDVSHKDAFRAVALEWKDADANPNKGKVREEKPKPKPKEKADKEAAPKKKRATKKAAPVASSEGEDDKEADEDEESS
ncbi:myb-like DNA-binding domain-containing protein [Rhizoctonia solani AG-1 IA]|uniref:Myb-like DNA-binding domain-containing protein n=1 Tax=Thanatephorus cucumeris (strain AG1-IA) TaxID=983506 RepID=L8WY60_THACA|nr:myb-like DNA-binding domain-containing protein [Rhizoctonia solani AG-1 IA]